MSIVPSMMGSLSAELSAHSSQRDAGTRYREQDATRWQEILDQAHSVAAGYASSEDPHASAHSRADGMGTRQQGDRGGEWGREDGARRIPTGTATSVPYGVLPASVSSGSREPAVLSMVIATSHASAAGDDASKGGSGESGATAASSGARAWAIHEQVLKAAGAAPRQEAPVSAVWVSDAGQSWKLYLRAQGLQASDAWTLAHALRAARGAGATAPLTSLVCNGAVVYDEAARVGTGTVFTG